MVAKITFPKRVGDALNYNEKKVQKGVAHFIGASGYLREAGDMNFYQKLEGLERRNELNDRATTKTMHVSLNFDPSEKLSDAILSQIAAQYMERIGFSDQPYLVYRHHDAGHPHVHIVSTTIRPDGSRINTHNLGRNGSERARKELEALFGLVRAEGQKQAALQSVRPIEASQVVYGHSETKRSVARVVSMVFNSYSFTSLPEYNAALRCFNVLADRGKEEGRIYRHRGLVYRILDESGEKVGVPIKASSLVGKPTLENLEGRFISNEKRRALHKTTLKEKIDSCLVSFPSSLQDLIDMLGKNGVFTLPRRNDEGRLYGITFVDNATRCVFNGSDLGKAYTAAAIQARLAVVTTESKTVPKEKTVENKTVISYEQPKVTSLKEQPKQLPKENLMDVLLASKPTGENVPSELLKKKRRRKKKTPGI